jgi:hypothetical protein
MVGIPKNPDLTMRVDVRSPLVDFFDASGAFPAAKGSRRPIKKIAPVV